MQGALKAVYRYRQLAGKCAAGAGLDFDEIGELTAIEAAFADDGSAPLDDRRIGERHFSRARVSHKATLVGRRFRDPIRILDLAPGGFVCERGPVLEAGDRAEVIVDADAKASTTYRFIAEVAWIRDRHDDCVIGFRFVGIPIEIRRPPPADRSEAGDRPAIAAA